MNFFENILGNKEVSKTTVNPENIAVRAKDTPQVEAKEVAGVDEVALGKKTMGSILENHAKRLAISLGFLKVTPGGGKLLLIAGSVAASILLGTMVPGVEGLFGGGVDSSHVAALGGLLDNTDHVVRSADQLVYDARIDNPGDIHSGVSDLIAQGFHATKTHLENTGVTGHGQIVGSDDFAKLANNPNPTNMPNFDHADTVFPVGTEKVTDAVNPSTVVDHAGKVTEEIGKSGADAVNPSTVVDHAGKVTEEIGKTGSADKATADLSGIDGHGVGQEVKDLSGIDGHGVGQETVIVGKGGIKNPLQRG